MRATLQSQRVHHHQHSRPLRLNSTSAAPTSDPSAPAPGEGMNATSAVSAVRTLQLGCQCSGWWLDMERHILTLVWNRPLGVSIMKLGGLKGYSAGSRMRPWYRPPCTGWGWEVG